MNAAPIQFIPPTAIAAAGTKSYYTAEAFVRIDKLTLANPTGGAAVISTYIVPKGAEPGTKTVLTIAESIGNGDTFNEANAVGHTMNSGDQLFVASDTAGVVLMGSGVIFQ